MNDVTIYTKDYCGYCAQAKTLLQAKSVAFTEIDVTHDPDLEAEMMERSGRRTVPQIFVGGEHVGGFDDLVALDASGQLDPLLAHDSGESDIAAQHHRVIAQRLSRENASLAPDQPATPPRSSSGAKMTASGHVWTAPFWQGLF